MLAISEEARELIGDSSVKNVGYEKEDFLAKFGLNNASFYASLEWGIRSAEILKRDNWNCKFCEDKYANYVHHIRGLRQYPEICLHPDFLITICVACHSHLHRK